MFGVGLLFSAIIVLPFVVGFIVLCIVAYRRALARKNRDGNKRTHQLRRNIVRKILGMLRAKSPGPDPERRLVRIAKSLEYRLYQNDGTIEEYQNEETLKPRLKNIVSGLLDKFSSERPSASDEMPSGDSDKMVAVEENGALDHSTATNNSNNSTVNIEHIPLLGSDTMFAAQKEPGAQNASLEIETAVMVDLENQTFVE